MARSASVRQLIDTHLRCRGLRHQWDDKGRYGVIYKGKNARVLFAQCKRCKGIRHDYILADGSKVGTKYDYPDGYLLAAPDIKDITDRNRQVRLEILHRSVEMTPEKAMDLIDLLRRK